MKKVILIFIVWAGCLNTLSAQWLNVFYPDLRRVTFPTANTGYAIGNGGELLKTTDGGTNWIVKPTPFTNYLNAIFFIDENIGLIAGGDSQNRPFIARTIDAGNSWTVVYTNSGGMGIVDLIMSSNTKGIAFLSSSSFSLVTQDGGLTWTSPIGNNPLGQNYPFYKSSFISDLVGFVVGSSLSSSSSIFKTTDGGQTWNKLDFTGQTLRSIYALDANTIYACGNGSGQGIILKSTNGGATYTTQVTDQTDLYDIQFTDANTGFAYGTVSGGVGSFVNKTANGGSSWGSKIAVTPSPSGAPYDFFMVNSSVGFAIESEGRISKTIDGWSTFTNSYLQPTGELKSVYFSDSQTGYAVGRNSSFLKTTNGAQTWQISNVLSSNLLNSTYFTSNAVGYAVGDNGTIVKTTDNGTSWSPLTSSVTDHLNGLTFIDNNIGLVVGANGKIIKTVNAGSNWVAKISNTTNTLNGISQKSGVALAVGNSGTILKSTDGGETWVAKPSGQTVKLNCVQVVSSSLAFVSADDGKIIKSIDGGETWSQLFTTIPSGQFLSTNSIYFSDENSGVAVVGGTTPTKIYRTSDGGSSWTGISQTNNGSNFNSVFSPSSLVSVIVGTKGRVFTSVCSNPTISNQPGSQTLTAGQTLNLSVTATGTGTISYQWKRDGTNVGTNNSLLTLNGIGAGDAGNYTVTVTDGCGSATSSAAVIKVLASEAGAQPTQFTLTAATASSLSFSFTGATGAPDGYIVLRRANNAVADAPTDGVAYSNGASIGNSTVVQSSAALTVTDNGLTQGNIYHYSVFAYKGSGAAINYLTSSPLQGTSVAAAPSVQPTSLLLTAATNTSASFSFTAATGADGYIVVRKGGASPTDVPLNTNTYTAGASIGTSTIAYVGTANTFTDSGLTTGSIYFYSVYSFKGAGLSTSYLTTAPLQGTSVAVAPTVQPTSLLLTAATNTSASFSFTTATGADGYVVVRKAGSSPTDGPLNTNTYVAGATIGTSTVAYVGAATTFTDSGLTTGAVYFYSVYSFKGAGLSTSYLTTAPLQGNALSTEPANHIANLNFGSFSATGFNVSFSAAVGSPAGYLVVRKKETAPTAIPADGAIYTVGATLGDAVVTSVGTTTSFDQTSLDPGSRYFFQVFPYNGVGVSTNYLTTNSTNNVGIGITIPAAPNAISAINVLFDTFTARWDPVAGATKYSLDVSEKNDFTTFVAGYQAKETTALIETVSGVKINTTYYYRVRAVNTSGSSSLSNVISAKTNDVPAGTTPLQAGIPVFSATFPSDEQQQKVSITLSGGLGARTVSFFYRGITASSFLRADAVAVNQNQFEATITRQLLDDFGLEFYLEAKDGAFTATTNQFTIRRSFSGSTSPTVPTNLFGGTAQSYQIISIPLAVEDNLIQTIFGSVLGAYDDTKWRIVRYQNGGNVDYPVINKIELGKSYWFNSVNKVEIKAGVGSTPDVSRTKPFVLSLSTGWNQIATPFPFNIDWDDILADNGNPTGVGKYKVYVPSSVSFAETNSLQPYSGGFVFADQARDLNLLVTLKSRASGGRKATNAISSDIGKDEWMVPITLSQGKAVNPLGGVGMHPQASQSKDNFDDITLPRFIKHLEFNSYHEDFVAPRFSKDIVPTSDKHIWDIAIESNFDEGAITLSWAGLDLGSNEAQLILFDQAAGVLVDMKKVTSYQLPNAARQDLQIIYHRDKKMEVGSSILLGKPFPNPSSGEVTFNLFSATPTDGQLEIVDLMGQKMIASDFSLDGERVKAVRWAGTHANETQVAPGIYIYKIVTSSKTIQGRILIK